MWEFISLEIAYSILEQTPMIFDIVKEGIIEIMDEYLSFFRSEMVSMMGALTMTFHEFRACGALKFFRKKNPIAIRCWLADVRNAFRSSLCPEEAKV